MAATDHQPEGSAELVRQERAIARAGEVLARDQRVLAAWLVGSFATAEADAYSDVDLHCLITDESADWFRQHWQETATEIVGPLVLASPISGVIGGYTLTPQWLHLDLIMHPRSELDPQSIAGLRPLFDRSGDLLPAEPVPLVRRGEPFFPDGPIKLFLYYLGNLPVGIGRGELVHIHGGIFTWREILIQVMLAENGIRTRGGNKRLNPLLTAEQRHVLESLPIAEMSFDEILIALRAIAREFIRRGKRLAERTGTSWPHELEEAALANIRHHHGIDFTA